jgi:hypothetical protein
VIRLNVFADAFTKVPSEQTDHEWPELCEVIEALVQTTAREKTSLPAVTFGTLSEAYNVNANYLNHTALAIDVDECSQETLDALDALGLALLVYASPERSEPRRLEARPNHR